MERSGHSIRWKEELGAVAFDLDKIFEVVIILLPEP
jgi:hypothetical protein